MSVARRGVRISAHVKRLFESGSVRAGILAGATYSADMYKDAKTGKMVYDNRTGMHVATFAAALEYGEGQNHPRPFMQKTFTANKKDWSAAFIALLKAGKTVPDALLTMGLVMKEDIQETVRAWPADNSERWAETKGFNHGLIQTGHLQNSIESEVEGAE